MQKSLDQLLPTISRDLGNLTLRTWVLGAVYEHHLNYGDDKSKEMVPFEEYLVSYLDRRYSRMVDSRNGQRTLV